MGQLTLRCPPLHVASEPQRPIGIRMTRAYGFANGAACLENSTLRVVVFFSFASSVG